MVCADASLISCGDDSSCGGEHGYGGWWFLDYVGNVGSCEGSSVDDD